MDGSGGTEAPNHLVNRLARSLGVAWVGLVAAGAAAAYQEHVTIENSPWGYVAAGLWAAAVLVSVGWLYFAARLESPLATAFRVVIWTELALVVLGGLLVLSLQGFT